MGTNLHVSCNITSSLLKYFSNLPKIVIDPFVLSLLFREYADLTANQFSFPRIIYREARDDDSSGRDTPIVSLYSRSVNQTTNGCTVEDVLQLLRHVYVLGTSVNSHNNGNKSLLLQHVHHHEADVDGNNWVHPEDFTSKKITNKVAQQIQDPLSLAAGALPSWCEELARSCPFLLPFETRRLYFNCTAFGASRSIVWLQTQRDAVLERQRAPGLSPRRDDVHEFRVGRLKHERVSVPRGDKLLDWAEQVLKVRFLACFVFTFDLS